MNKTDPALRCIVDTASRKASFADATTNGPLLAWKGAVLRIDVGLFYGRTFIDDVSGIATISMDLRPTGAGSATITMSQAIVSCTPADWTNGLSQHASFLITDATMRIDAGTYVLVVYGSRVDTQRVVFGMSQMTVIDTLVGTPGSYIPTGGGYPTPDELMALFASCVKFIGNPPGSTLTMAAADGSKRIIGVGAGGLPIDSTETGN